MMRTLLSLLFLIAISATALFSGEAELILHGGKVVTVDAAFSVHAAIAIADGKILKTGSDAEVLALRGAKTEVIDLGGKMVLPGLIDSHTHPNGASLTEFDHPIPDMESVQDVLDYFAARVKAVKPGDWIVLQQVFITRLREQRYPTRAEMDAIAPANPVLFRTGPDASLNSLALKLSGIDRDFKVSDGGPGFVEKDAAGEPTGILRNCTRFVKVQNSGKQPTNAEKLARLTELFKDYNAAGITMIADRDASIPGVELFKELRDTKRLSVRIAVSHGVPYIGSMEQITTRIKNVADDPLYKERDPWLRVIGVKTYLDGGMLTGSAYMREPWGVSSIYAITDPQYRGVIFIQREKLRGMVRAAAEAKLQFTAHSVGDGAVHELLGVYEELSKEVDLRSTRPCVTHANFQSKEAIEIAARLGVVMDIQPAWLYLDTRTLVKQFGLERLRYFQPLKSLFAAGVTVGGGSDHMQKIGAVRSINPYSPFLGMATAMTRRAKWYEGTLHAEEALTREQVLRMYTINNAKLLFAEEKLGSLEAGKLADLVVIDTDLLTCSEEKIAGTAVLSTYVEGRLVYRK